MQITLYAVTQYSVKLNNLHVLPVFIPTVGLYLMCGKKTPNVVTTHKPVENHNLIPTSSTLYGHVKTAEQR